MTDITVSVLRDAIENDVAGRLTTDGRVFIAADDLEAATGWHLDRPGLCQGEICVPTPLAATAIDAGEVDLASVAGALRLPQATWVDAFAPRAVTAWGRSADDVAMLNGGRSAPDVTLPTLDGNEMAVLEQDGRKRLLLAFASW